jgi:hypothetical protein
MIQRLLVIAAAAVASVALFAITSPAPAYAAGSCSLAPLVCANDSSPGCETICGGEQQAVCIEGSCTAAGNILTTNHCSCK